MAFPTSGIPSGMNSSLKLNLMNSIANSMNLSGLKILQISNLHKLSGCVLLHTPGSRWKSGLFYHDNHSSVDNLNPEISPLSLGCLFSITIICSHCSWLTNEQLVGLISVDEGLDVFFSYTKVSYI